MGILLTVAVGNDQKMGCHVIVSIHMSQIVLKQQKSCAVQRKDGGNFLLLHMILLVSDFLYYNSTQVSIHINWDQLYIPTIFLFAKLKKAEKGSTRESIQTRGRSRKGPKSHDNYPTPRTGGQQQGFAGGPSSRDCC